MSDTWDAEDRAIARALDAATDAETQGADEHLVDAYREVLGHISPAEVTPPAELEDRIVAAALERRAAAVPTLDRVRARRTRRVRLAALATAAAAAVVVVGLIVSTGTSAPSRPGGHVTLTAVQRSDVDAILRTVGTRTAEFVTTKGRVAIAPNGNGVVFGLAGTDPLSIGLLGNSGTTVIGPARPAGGAIAFVVDHPERVEAVTLLRGGIEIARVVLRPN